MQEREYVFPASRGISERSENGGGHSGAGEGVEGFAAQTVHSHIRMSRASEDDRSNHGALASSCGRPNRINAA